MLKGKSVIVTGGGSGMGRATALILARGGNQVMIADVDEAGGNETLSMITKDGGQGAFVRTDVSDDGDVQRLVRETVQRFGGLHAAFNNAGVENLSVPLHEIPLDVWHRRVGINLTGVFLCMKHEIPAMLHAGGGAIVNTASVAGVVAYSLMAEYAAAKHGVVGLTKAAAIEYGPQKIRVNAILPGPIDTPMSKRAFADLPGLEEERFSAISLRRMGQPAEIGEAVAWLLSDAASFVTGVCLPVDGGQTAKGA